MPELTNLRTRHSKTFDLGNGQRELVSCIREVHYPDADSAWQEIDSNLRASSGGYDYENTANDFTVKFKSDLKSADPIVFTRNGVSVSFRPRGVALFDRALNAYTIIASPNNTTATVTANGIEWANLYPNVDCGIYVRPNGIKEYIRVHASASVPDPSTYGYDPATTFLVMVSEIAYTGADSVEDEQGAITQTRDLGKVDFIKSSVPQFWIPELAGWEETPFGTVPVRHVMKKRLKVISGTPYLLHGVSFDKFVAAKASGKTYTIDTTLERTVPGNDSDGFSTGSSFDASGQYLFVGANGYDAGEGDYQVNVYTSSLRFANITIDNSTTINSAHLHVTSAYTNAASHNVTIKGCDTHDDCPVLSSSHNAIVWTSTTASVAWPSATHTLNVEYQSPDIASIISEITSRAGWTSGYDLSIGLYNNCSDSGYEFYHYWAWYSNEHASGAPASLHIVYGESSDATVSVTDTLAATDSLDKLQVGTVLASVADAFAAADVLSDVDVTTQGPLEVSVSDSLVATEYLAPSVGTLLLSLADAITATDALTSPRVGSLLLALAEALQGADSASVTIGDLLLSVGEALQASDATTAKVGGILLSLIETAQANDGASVTIGQVILAVSTAMQASDSVTARIGTVLLSVADAIAASDATNVKIGQVLLSLADALSSTESADVILGGVTVSVGDTLSAQESVEVLLPVLLELIEALAANDSASVTIGQVILSLAEAISAGEAANETVGGVLLSLGESLSAADLASIVAPLILQLEDALAASDSTTVDIGDVILSVADALDATGSVTAGLGQVIVALASALSAADSLATPKVGTVLVRRTTALHIEDEIDDEDLRISGLKFSLTDALSAAEDRSITVGGLLLSLATSLSAQDAATISASGDLLVSLLDTLSADESLDPRIGPVTFSLTDALAATDSAESKVGTLILQLAEAIAAADTLSDPRVGNLILSLASALSAGDEVRLGLGATQVSVSTALAIADALEDVIGEVKLSLADSAQIDVAAPTLTLSGPTAAITGSATAGINELDVVAGGKTIVITLTGAKWIAS